MIQIVAMAGSPRRGGNSDTLLERFVDGARSSGAETIQIVLARLDVAGCVACNGCWGDGQCIVQDNFQGVNEQLVAADVIALAAPLFFWNLPAQAKALIDRAQSQWARKYKVKASLPPTAAGRTRRRGVYIGVGGEQPADFSGTVKTVRGLFSLYEADYWADLLVSGVDARGEIERHPAALQQAFDLGVRAAAWPADSR